MSEATQKSVSRIRDAIDKEGKNLRGTDWYEFLEEVSGIADSYQECYREEHPEDFE